MELDPKAVEMKLENGSDIEKSRLKNLLIKEEGWDNDFFIAKDEAIIELEFKTDVHKIAGLGLVLHDFDHPERFPTKVEVQIKDDDDEWTELKTIESW